MTADLSNGRLSYSTSLLEETTRKETTEEEKKLMTYSKHRLRLSIYSNKEQRPSDRDNLTKDPNINYYNLFLIFILVSPTNQPK